MNFSLPPQVMLDLEDCPRLRRRRDGETDKPGALRAASLSETKSRSESKHRCQTNVKVRPHLPSFFPPGTCPGCSREWLNIYASPHNYSIVLPCGHLLCSVCRMSSQVSPEVSCRDSKCKKTFPAESVKTLYL